MFNSSDDCAISDNETGKIMCEQFKQLVCKPIYIYVVRPAYASSASKVKDKKTQTKKG